MNLKLERRSGVCVQKDGLGGPGAQAGDAEVQLLACPFRVRRTLWHH